MDSVNSLVESMYRFCGQTVTIFTTSGGISGCGFTGVLISVDANCVRLLCDVGAAPACPIGSSCGNCGSNSGYGYGSDFGGYDGFYGGNPLGSVAVIPTCAIACFTHNAI